MPNSEVSRNSGHAIVRVNPDEWKVPVPVGNLSHVISNRDIQLEYRILRYMTETSEMAMKMDKTGAAAGKDRYRDIVPFLSNKIPLPGDSYINASYVSDFRGNSKAFIAAQGPLAGTVHSFWSMVFQDRVTDIFALCKLFEGNKEKCFGYWPTQADRPLDTTPGEGEGFPLTVTLLEEREEPEMFVREFKVECLAASSEPLRCTQYHFTTWPDHGVPPVPSMLPLWKKLDPLVSGQSPSSPPILIHCSAGVGRSGCLIAISNLLSSVRSQASSLSSSPSVSVLQTALELRESRPYMIQTSAQYVLIYEALNFLLPELGVDTSGGE